MAAGLADHIWSCEENAALLDVNAAVDWLSEQRGINSKRIAILGSGLGANLAGFGK